MTVLATSICGIQALRLDSSARGNQSQHRESDLSDANSLRLLKQSPNIGFGNIVSNYGFLRFLQYFGDDEVREVTGYELSPLFFEAILRHDPNYRDYYLFLSGSSTIRAGLPDKTVSLMSENLEHLSPTTPQDSYYIWRYKAVDELLFLGEGESARQSFSTAAKWADQSRDLEASQMAKLSKRSADFLTDNPDSRSAQIDAWRSLLSTALDKDTRIRAIEKIEELGGSITITEDGRIKVQYEKTDNAAQLSGNSGT